MIKPFKTVDFGAYEMRIYVEYIRAEYKNTYLIYNFNKLSEDQKLIATTDCLARAEKYIQGKDCNLCRPENGDHCRCPQINQIV